MNEWWYRSTVAAVAKPRPIYPEHRADFLTMVLENGQPEFIGANQADTCYQLRPDSDRAMVRRAYVKAGMTRYLLDGLADYWDGFANPPALIPFMQELRADGLGPMVAVHPEDQPRMQQKYRALPYYLDGLNYALTVWQPYLTELLIGVECDEPWKNGLPGWSPDDILEVGATAAETIPGLHISVHFKSGRITPRNVHLNWLNDAKQAGITHLEYQVVHPPVEDSGGAFLSDPNTIKSELASVVQRVAGRLHVISSEYAYFGTHPTPQILAHVSSEGYRLGDKSLEVPGVIGFSNGGPGYWPPEEPQPGTGVDDIDINQVHFYSTHPYRDITNEIRAWPVDSKLTPEFFNGGTKIRFAHTQAASWPVYEGGNANTWSIIWLDGAWRGYTTDYLRPGHQSTDKDWLGPHGINHWVKEPITYRIKSGETFYVMVSRQDPRLDKYPTGKSRTNIVKVVSP